MSSVLSSFSLRKLAAAKTFMSLIHRCMELYSFKKISKIADICHCK